MNKDAARVLLVWPGGIFGGGGNFGVPQLLSIAGAIRQQATAIVDVVDLGAERALGFDLRRVIEERGPYDIIGISCYSSFDALRVQALAEHVREWAPRAWLVTGGYHPSARPDEMADAFDFVIVGDGEAPMARLVSAFESGKRPLMRTIGPESVPDPNSLPPVEWSLLDRYRPVARQVASQAEIYLSRGCPYDCAFCMERAKRDVSWRALVPERAIEEMHRLDSFLDLSSWTVFIADALFGMKVAWRKAFLEALAKRPVRARKVWLLIRLDLIDEEDIRLMARANVSPGFGLESGDPEHVRRIRKAGRLNDYLDRMMRIAEWARKYEVPFGANVIVGHPGETEKSMRTSAAYLKKLFVENETMGFLSVDPFRLYPGSPIDEERAQWEAETGMRIHRYPWWNDGDQEFLSEWVDPSGSLDYRTTQRLRRELFDPIVRAIPDRFAYRGPARDYFMRAIDEQVALRRPKRLMHELGLYHLWRELTGKRAPSVADDGELAAIARTRREETMPKDAPSAIADALRKVPRERFVRTEDIAISAEDRALALDDSRQATISALHAYAHSFAALDLGPGDTLVELGAGSGYGVALAAHITRGRVLGIEIDEALAAWAKRNVANSSHAEILHGDAHDTALWQGATKVSVAFSIDRIPAAWLCALAPNGILVAPVGRPQILTLFTRDGTARPLSKVSYVRDRSVSSL